MSELIKAVLQWGIICRYIFFSSKFSECWSIKEACEYLITDTSPSSCLLFNSHNTFLVLSVSANAFSPPMAKKKRGGKKKHLVQWQPVCHIVSGDSVVKDTALPVRSAVLICYMSAHYFPWARITLDSIIKCHVITCYGVVFLPEVPPGIHATVGERMMG